MSNGTKRGMKSKVRIDPVASRRRAYIRGISFLRGKNPSPNAHFILFRKLRRRLHGQGDHPVEPDMAGQVVKAREEYARFDRKMRRLESLFDEGRMSVKELNRLAGRVDAPRLLHMIGGNRDWINVIVVQDYYRRRIAAKYTLDLLRVGHGTHAERKLRSRILSEASGRIGWEYLSGRPQGGIFHIEMQRHFGGDFEKFLRTFRGFYDQLSDWPFGVE